MSLRTPYELGSAVRKERTAAGLTQEELGRRAGVSREWVVRLERGARGVELGHVLSVLTALRMVLDYEVDAESVDPLDMMFAQLDGDLDA